MILYVADVRMMCKEGECLHSLKTSACAITSIRHDAASKGICNITLINRAAGGRKP